VTFNRDELVHTIWETWVGINYELKSGLNISLFARHRQAELDLPGAREPVWGGLVFSKTVK